MSTGILPLTDPIFTILPCDSLMKGMNVFVTLTVPLKLTSMILLMSLDDMISGVPTKQTPALLTMPLSSEIFGYIFDNL